ILGLFPLVVVAGSLELDVVGLPHQRREAGVHGRLGDLIDAAALVVFPFQAERVEHLHFIAALDIDAAVAAPLAAGLGHEGSTELDVERMVAELFLGIAVGRHEITVFGHLAVVPLVGVLAVEEDDGVLGRLGAERGALALDLLHLADFLAVDRDGNDALLEDRLVVVELERDRAVLEFSLGFVLVVAALPSVARESAAIADAIELAVSQRDDLRAAAGFVFAILE